MKTTGLKLFLILLLTVMAWIIRAQKVNSLYFLENTAMHTRMNPAMAPKHSSVGLGMSNIALSMESDLAFSDLFFLGSDGSLISFMHPDTDKALFLSNLGEVSGIGGSLNMEIMNVGIRIKQSYISFHSGIYMEMGLGMPKDFFRLFMLGMDANQTSTQFDLSPLQVNARAYNKTGLGFSTAIGKIFSLGVNLDYLSGLGDVNMSFDELSIHASDRQWNVVSKGRMRYTGPKQLKFVYDTDNYMEGIETEEGSDMNFMEFMSVGRGFSLDVGMTAKPLAFLNLSASLCDLGYIRWNKDYVQQAYSNETFSFTGLDMGGDFSENEEDENKLGDQFQALIRMSQDASTASFVSRLTGKLNLGAEAGILDNRLSLGILSQTAFSDQGLVYQDFMLAANFKPGSMLQTALTYSLLHGKMSSFGAALNLKLAFINLFMAADFIPTIYSPQMIPVNNSRFNLQTGLNVMF